MEKREYNDLMKAIKRANQRLRQLEKSGLNKENPAYKHVITGIKKGAKYYTETKEGAPKFRTDIKSLTTQSLNALKVNVYDFLKMKTSTVSGVKNIYKKGYETYKKRHPDVKISQEDFRRLWGTQTAEIAKMNYGSDRMVNIIKNKPDEMSIDKYIEFIEGIHAESLTERQFEIEFEKLKKKAGK